MKSVALGPTDSRIILSDVASAKKKLKEKTREAERQGWRVGETKKAIWKGR